MANPFDISYQEPQALTALFRGFDQAYKEQEQASKLQEIQQLAEQRRLQNERYSQMTPLELQKTGLEAAQAQAQNNESMLQSFVDNARAKQQEQILKTQQAEAKQPLLLKQIPVQGEIDQRNLDIQNQISQIDQMISRGGIDQFGNQATPQQMQMWNNERQKLVGLLANTPEQVAKLQLEGVKGENALNRAIAIQQAKPTQVDKLTDDLAKKGYRLTDTGNLEYIPGGPADPSTLGKQTEVKLSAKDQADREAKYPKVAASLQNFSDKADKLQEDLVRLANHPGLSGITGLIFGRTPALTDQAREAQALYNSIKARGGFNELAEMRQNSPTGGALGSISDRENTMLQSAFAPIDQTQSKQSMQRALIDAAKEVGGSKKRLKNAFDLTYEYRGSTGQQNPVQEQPSFTSEQSAWIERAKKQNPNMSEQDIIAEGKKRGKL